MKNRLWLELSRFSCLSDFHNSWLGRQTTIMQVSLEASDSLVAGILYGQFSYRAKTNFDVHIL